MSDQNDKVEEFPSRELPLSTIENTPPLMLDLPDGQQLVVGKLPDGIVIEIATWRGTGRPDSRTNRMMLGVSYDEDDLEEKPKRALLKKFKRENELSEGPEASPVVPATIAVESLVTPEDVQVADSEIAEEVNAVAEPEIAEEVVMATESAIIPEVVESTEMESFVAEEVVLIPNHNNGDSDELAELAAADVPVFSVDEIAPPPRNMQDLFGARPRAQLEDETHSQMIERGHEIVRKPSKKSVKKFQVKRLVKPVGTLVATALGIILLIGPAGIKFTLPEGGLSTSLSSAKNAVVIVRESDEYQIGDTVVASVIAPENPDYFANIAAQSDVEFVLTENNLYHSALREEVKGKVVLVVPGIGFLLHKLGL
jgi:hypothetical protein